MTAVNVNGRRDFGECPTCGAGLPGIPDHQDFCWTANPALPNLGGGQTTPTTRIETAISESGPFRNAYQLANAAGVSWRTAHRHLTLAARATTTPGDPPLAGVVVGRSEPGQPNSCGLTPPAHPHVKTGSLPAKAGRPDRPPQNATNPGAADPGAVYTSAAANSGAASPS